MQPSRKRMLTLSCLTVACLGLAATGEAHGHGGGGGHHGRGHAGYRGHHHGGWPSSSRGSSTAGAGWFRFGPGGTPHAPILPVVPDPDALPAARFHRFLSHLAGRPGT